MRFDFFTDPAINMLSLGAKFVLITIFKQSLRENSEKISICLEYVKDQLRVDLDVVKLALRELKESNIIDLESRVRTQLIEENRIEENRIEENRKIEKLYATGFFGDDYSANWILEKVELSSLEKLISDYGKKTVFTYLETVSDYCQANGKTYKNYLSAVRNFMKRDGVMKLSENADKPDDMTDAEKIGYIISKNLGSTTMSDDAIPEWLQ